MRVIRTEHHCEYDQQAGYRYADVEPPHPGAVLRFIEWPDDPKAQPLLLTWVVPKNQPIQMNIQQAPPRVEYIPVPVERPMGMRR